MLLLQNFNRFIDNIPILRQINIELHSGEVVCLLGPNGAGKSTLLTTLCAPFPNYEGKIFYKTQGKNQAWKDLQKAAYRKQFLNQCSYLGHETGLFYDLSVEQNLKFFHTILSDPFTRSMKKRREQSQKKINVLLELANLFPYRNQVVRLLSRGLKQRVALLRCFLPEPKIFLIDEPLTSLDANGIRIFHILFSQAIKNGCLAIIATHEQEFFKKHNLATRFLFLKEGRLIADIPVKDYSKRVKKKVEQMLYK